MRPAFVNDSKHIFFLQLLQNIDNLHIGDTFAIFRGLPGLATGTMQLTNLRCL